MKAQSVLAVWIGLAAGVGCIAQTAPTQQSVEARLRGPFLMLRGMYDGRTLEFAADGKLEGKAGRLPFGLSALRVDGIRMKDSEVEIDATREGLVFPPNDSGEVERVRAEPWGSQNTVAISIARDPRHPEKLDSALTKVFAVGLESGLARQAPQYWRMWLKHQLDPSFFAMMPRPAVPLGNAGNPPTAQGQVKPQQIVHAPPADLPAAAREAKYVRTSVLGVMINANGVVQEIYILRPAGMGLDEVAGETVRHHQFQPAMVNGASVAIITSIQVEFRLQ